MDSAFRECRWKADGATCVQHLIGPRRKMARGSAMVPRFDGGCEVAKRFHLLRRAASSAGEHRLHCPLSDFYSLVAESKGTEDFSCASKVSIPTSRDSPNAHQFSIILRRNFVLFASLLVPAPLRPRAAMSSSLPGMGWIRRPHAQYPFLQPGQRSRFVWKGAFSSTRKDAKNTKYELRSRSNKSRVRARLSGLV